MSTPIKRKLATILSADVAGYSRLMGDGELTLDIPAQPGRTLSASAKRSIHASR